MEDKQLTLAEENEVEYILGNPPSWIIKWGTTIVFLAVLLFLTISWIIKYPDVIPAAVTITTNNPSIKVMAPTSGKITTIFVKPNQEVSKETVLAVIEDAADWKDIQSLSQFLLELQNIQHTEEFLSFKVPSNLKLGNIQNTYSFLSEKIKDFQNFQQLTITEERHLILNGQISDLELLNQSIERQGLTLAEELELARLNFERNDALLKEGLISEVDLESIKGGYLRYKRQYEEQKTRVINNAMSIKQFRNQILELQNNKSESLTSKELSIREDIQKILGAIENWKKRFLLVAPVSGKVSMSNIWSEQQFIKAQDVAFSIVPDKGDADIIGKATLPLDGAGKVKNGQRANIRLKGYPFQEFGVLKASIKNISLVPNEEHYTLDIDIPDSLVTTYGKIIPFKQEMSGTANIITNDKRIIERVFDKILNLVKNN